MQRIVAVIVFFAFGAFAQDLQTILERARMKNTNTAREAGGTNQYSTQTDSQAEANGGVVGDRSPSSVPTRDPSAVPTQNTEIYNKLEFKKASVETSSNTNANTDGQARCVPHFLPGKRGQVNGFKCFQVQNNRALAEAGLQEGDVILSVDDQRLISSDDVVRTYSKLGARDYSQIVVLRDGKQVVLSR